MKINNRYYFIIAAIVLVGAAFYFFTEIVAFVLISWVLSMIGQPFMKFFLVKLNLGKYRFGPPVSALFTLVSFFLIFTLLIYTFVPLVVEQVQNLAGIDYQDVASALDEPIHQLDIFLERLGFINEGTSVVEDITKKLQEYFGPETIGAFLSSMLGFAGTLLFAFFTITFITFFFLKEQKLFSTFLSALTPNKYEDSVLHIMDDTSRLLTRYFGGILVQIAIITTYVSITLSILGIKNAILIGFFAALVNVIPYIGPLIGALFGVLVTISANVGPEVSFYAVIMPQLIKVVIVFASMQLIDNILLQPVIFSNSVKAHPLEIFLVILIGAQLGNIVGMLLAIPAYTVIRIIAKNMLSEFKIVQKLTNSLKS